MDIHPQLLQDCHVLGKLPGTWLLLHKNAAVHWLILVPETSQTDFLDLPEQQQQQILAQAASLSALLKKTYGYPKINFAAIGNVVPQMHLHIVGRHPHDPCWPAPVWGNLPPGPEYRPEQIEDLKQHMNTQ